MNWQKMHENFEKFAKFILRHITYLVISLVIIAAYIFMRMYVYKVNQPVQWRELSCLIAELIAACVFYKLYIWFETRENRAYFLWCLSHLTVEHIALVIIVALVLYFGAKITIISAFIAIGSLLAKPITSIITGFIITLEDVMKLTENYDDLVKRYKCVKLVNYNGTDFPGEELTFRGIKDTPFEFEVDNSKKDESYCIPPQIEEKAGELLNIYQKSNIYNSQTVRLESCVKIKNKIYLTYSRANYYDLLITNRVMDYPFSLHFSLRDGFHVIRSIREIYEPGPFLSSLSESKLANHLGFNGFVELADGKIIFVKRNPKVSMGKNIWSPSVNKAYNVKDGLDEHRRLSEDKMWNAIRKAVDNELKISLGNDFPLQKSIFAFYRDLVQGGKPHFVFYLKVPNLTAEQFEQQFKEKLKQELEEEKESKKRKEMFQKGVQFKFFTLQQLQASEIRPDMLRLPDEKPLKMQPFGTVPLVLLLKHLSQA